MNTIKRWDFVGGDGPCAYPMEEPDGRMVAYTDHVAELAALREELDGYKQGAKIEADAADEARAALKAAEQRNTNLLKALSIAQRALASANFLIYKHVPDHNWSAYIRRDIEAIKTILAGGDYVEEPTALAEIDRTVMGMLKWTAQGALESGRWPDGTLLYVAKPVAPVAFPGYPPAPEDRTLPSSTALRRAALFLSGMDPRYTGCNEVKTLNRLVAAAQGVAEPATTKPKGHCRNGDHCVCGGDTEGVRAQCDNWIKP